MALATEHTDRETGETDVISLTVPAAGQFARLARIAGASIARRRGLSVRAIDDLRLAIDEAFSLLLQDKVHVGSVAVTFEVDDHELVVIIAQGIVDGPLPADGESQMAFDVVITDLVDRVEVDADVGVVQFSKFLKK